MHVHANTAVQHDAVPSRLSILEITSVEPHASSSSSAAREAVPPQHKISRSPCKQRSMEVAVAVQFHTGVASFGVEGENQIKPAS
eukprot:3005336-Amphidinium_carterae.2